MAATAISYWQEKRVKEEGTLVLSYRSLRNAIGLIGAGFPVVLFVGVEIVSGQWPGSVSGYYFTSMRNVFVGALCAISVFLITYNGYDNLDRWITSLAGLFALGVAFCPTANPNFHPHWVGYLHQIFASLMMVFLALMSLQFTRSESTQVGDLRAQLLGLWRALRGSGVSPTADDVREAEEKLAGPTTTAEEAKELDGRIRKRQRNTIYIWCARLILLWIVCALLQNLINAPAWHLFFFCEVLCLWTFAVSWFTKGQVLRKEEV